jgi:hypothetical protein
LEECGPAIVYFEGIHNTAADAISHLEYGPIMNDRATWMTFTQCWCHYTVNMHTEGTSQADYEESMIIVFANCSEENAVYPITVWEIVESQSADSRMGRLKNQLGYVVQLVENMMILCKDGKLIIPKDLQDRAVAWYHHYLRHPPRLHMS